MEFTEVTEARAINDVGNLHVVCHRREEADYTLGQALVNMETDDERLKCVEDLNKIGWRIGDDGNTYCPSCVEAMMGE